MAGIVWVRHDVVLAIHARQIAEHGGTDGIRDTGLVDSAIARPRNLLDYSDASPDIASLAAAYAFGHSAYHPFVDGNKRTSLVVTLLFLALNGRAVEATQEEKYTAFSRLAAGELDQGGMADWLRERMTPMV